MSQDVDSRLNEASKQQTDAMVQMSEQIARAVSTESTAQANRIEQMFGQVMAAKASSNLLLTKKNNQDKEATPPDTTAALAHPAPDVHEQRRIKAIGRKLLQVKVAMHERQRIHFTHKVFAALKQHTQDSIMSEMATKCKGGHNISQLAAKLSIHGRCTWRTSQSGTTHSGSRFRRTYSSMRKVTLSYMT
jgi:hypothetical protein